MRISSKGETVERLIKNGDIILDGTLTRCEKERQALLKLGEIEEILSKHKVRNIKDLDERLGKGNK